MKQIGIGLGLLSLMLMGSVSFPSGVTAVGNSTVVGEKEEVKELSTMEKFNILKKAKIFKGSTDGKAFLDEKMTRAQLATVLDRMFHLTAKFEGKSFLDTKNHWAEYEIAATTAGGYMKVGTDNQFLPNQPVSHEELAFAVVKALGLTFESLADGSVENSSKEYRTYIAVGLDKELLKPVKDYRTPALRSDLVNVMYRVSQLKQQGNGGIVAGSIEPSVKVSKLETGGYQFTFTFKNQTEREQTLIFRNGQRFDYGIYKDGEKVYHYSADKSFIMMYQELVLKQGEELTYTDTLADLPEGEYTLDYWLTADKQDIRGKLEFK
jgi:hypothetical protein